MGKDVIVACDFASAERTYEFLDLFTDRKPFVKIGMELYYAEGPQIVREIKRRGHKIFLDLKLHDIPNTVKKAMAVLSGLDVDICNLHAGGTAAMMRARISSCLAVMARQTVMTVSGSICLAFFTTASNTSSKRSAERYPRATHASRRLMPSSKAL